MAKYNLAVKEEVGLAYEHLAHLVISGAEIVEIKKLSPRRSLNQNAYLHLILGYFGTKTGYTLEEAKTLYKQLNHDVYKYIKNGRPFYKSSADLNKEDMSKTIDKFCTWSAENGVPLPQVTDEAWLRSIGNDIERSRRYL